MFPIFFNHNAVLCVLCVWERVVCFSGLVFVWGMGWIMYVNCWCTEIVSLFRLYMTKLLEEVVDLGL